MLRLVRVSEYDGATLGILLLDDKPLWKTLELPWRDNQPMVSCIPDGVYTAIKYSSPKFGRVLHVLDVPGRSGILFHAGNTIADTHGCILPGLTFGVMEGQPCVWESKKAMERLLEAVRNFDEISLKVVSILS